MPINGRIYGTERRFFVLRVLGVANQRMGSVDILGTDLASRDRQAEAYGVF